MEPVQPEEEIMRLQAPARPDREMELPTIEVTAVEQEEKRTSPEHLDMREVMGDTNLQLPNIVGEEEPPAVAVQVQLEPLVPKEKTRAKKGRKIVRPVVDTVLQLRGQDIKSNIEDGGRQTVRCEHASQDLVAVDVLLPVCMKNTGHQLGEMLRETFYDVLEEMTLQRVRSWDWQELDLVRQVVEQDNQDGVPEERQDVSPSKSVAGNLSVPVDTTRKSLVMESNNDGTQLSAREGGQDLRVQEQEGYMDRTPDPLVADIPCLVEEGNVVDNDVIQVPYGDTEAQLAGAQLDLEPDATTKQQQLDLFMELQTDVTEEQQQDVAVLSENVRDNVNYEEVRVTAVSVWNCLQEKSGDNGFCYFKDLCHEDNTSRREAAQSFYRILKMEKQDSILTAQEESFGSIRIQLRK